MMKKIEVKWACENRKLYDKLKCSNRMRTLHDNDMIYNGSENSGEGFNGFEGA